MGSEGEEIAAYWTKNPKNFSATHAFIMIHGKLRDGDNVSRKRMIVQVNIRKNLLADLSKYWTIMKNILKKHDRYDKKSIIVAPEFFSTKYNSGVSTTSAAGVQPEFPFQSPCLLFFANLVIIFLQQYSKNELAWGDTNAWQASDIATHPKGTKLTAFDALDALVDEFANSTRYPAMKNITFVGHGGGGQLNQRYAMAAKDGPSNIHIRYIHGDPSSCAYFTTHRPVQISNDYNLPSKTTCEYYNTWRYGFENFTGTANGLKSSQQYFQQYITRDVISIVGYQDTTVDGDTTCMGNIQGGTARRDRNLAWWQYINTLARTSENLFGFPATYGSLPDWSRYSNNKIHLQLIVIENATHSAKEVFNSVEGQAALFSSGKMPTGWRPSGWTPTTSLP